MKKVRKVRAAWRVEKLHNTRSLYRLVGPLVKPKGHQRTMCVAIGSGKRLKLIAATLNAVELEI